MNEKKTIRVERVELIDKWGRTRAVFSPEYGVPHIAHYDGRGRILSWLTFLIDGTPDVRVFGQTEAHNAQTYAAVIEQAANGNESLT
jgi:hypothetical protein